MALQPRTIAVFDFDGTLVKGDSFWPFLCYVRGRVNVFTALIDALILYGVRFWKNQNDHVGIDFRTFMKAELLKRLLAGRRTDELPLAIAKLGAWVEWNKSMHKALLEHQSLGHIIVVASGGLDLYLHELLKELPIDALICTTIGTLNGKVTGVMTSGNCVRGRKAEMVAAYMEQHGPFESSWGYGNFPDDLPMLNLMKHRIIV